jgi:hypothetical protein
MNDFDTQPAAIVRSMDFCHLSDEELKQRVEMVHHAIVSNCLELGKLLKEWKTRGHDPDDFRLAGMARYLIGLADGKLIAGVFVAHWPDTALMDFYWTQDAIDQQRYLDGKTITVATGLKDGDQKEMTIEDILQHDKRNEKKKNKAPSLRSQVFYRNRINSLGQQRSIIEERVKSASRPVPETVAGVGIDKETQEAVFPRRGRHSLETLKKIVRALER